MVQYPAIIKDMSSKYKINVQFYDGLETEVDMSSVQKLHPDLQKEVGTHRVDLRTAIIFIFVLCFQMFLPVNENVVVYVFIMNP